MRPVNGVLILSLITQYYYSTLATILLSRQSTQLSLNNHSTIKMKFSAVALLAATASAASLGKRETVFSVSDFSAGCIRHSTQCLYSLTVIQPGTMETTGVQCKAMVSANTDGTLPDVKEGTCDQSSRTFDVTRGADGLTLTVSQPVTPSSNQTGSHLIPNDELAISNEPNAVVQSYTGPTSFDLE
ncbi:hypothetical protein M426DRAFT_317338 [Hypoxylon sp. CI-4A]|nr:hypothetical protein M426DRAFT_317338 [Hypoxylon sp. CI-4A]